MEIASGVWNFGCIAVTYNVQTAREYFTPAFKYGAAKRLFWRASAA
jgi:hypothetical protein